jgi:hypothetical protein
MAIWFILLYDIVIHNRMKRIKLLACQAKPINTYEGKSISKLQIVNEKERMKIMTYNFFSNIIYIQI